MICNNLLKEIFWYLH